MPIRPMLLAAAGCLALAACNGGSALMPEDPSISAPNGTVQARFAATDGGFDNPERGFYLPAANLDRLTADEASKAYAQGFRLLYTRIDLEPYRDGALPPAFLAQLEQGFAAARRSGVKLIVRAVYNYPRGETEYRDAKDASIDRVLEHIAALKPVWMRNSDVIAFVQAGFIGAWGEWHTSSNDLASEANRTRIKDALLDAAPAGRFVQFRYPPYIQGWAPNLPSAASSIAQGFRIGFHNDCFLASDTDVGTFDEDATKRSAQRGYLDRLGDVAPFGGETCNPADDPNPRPRTSCDDIRREGAQFNLTYLNTQYYRRLFHDRWQAEGCMDEVRRSMGYRIALVSASHPAAVARGGTLDLRVAARNDGWARIFNPRRVEVVLRGADGGVRRLAAGGVDPRGWLPGVEVTEVVRVGVPADLAAGTYQMWLALPDAAPAIAGDPRYAIRPANADNEAAGQRWDAQLGAFRLGTSIQVQ